MSQLTPASTSANDLCIAAMQTAGVIGLGQTPNPTQVYEVLAKLQWMLQQWQRKDWLVFCNQSYELQATGQRSYTVGPGGDLDTGQEVEPGTQGSASVRPSKLESAFLRLNNVQAGAQSVDYPLRCINSRDEYNDFVLKELVSFTQAVYYEPQWPLGYLCPLPVTQGGEGYSLWLTFRNQLPSSFSEDGSTLLDLPYEYYMAIVLNLAVHCRLRWQIPTFQGDTLFAQAKEALNVLRTTNYQMAPMRMPPGLSNSRSAGYNIFGDNYGN